MSARPAFTNPATFRPSSVFAGGLNPWTQKTMPASSSAPAAAPNANNPFPVKKRVMKGVDMATLVIKKNVPLPTARIVPGKYNEFFSKLVSKDVIECNSDEVDTVDNALRKYLKDSGKDKEFAAYRSKNLEGKPGRGGVWLWPKNELDSAPASLQSQGGRATAEKKRGGK